VSNFVSAQYPAIYCFEKIKLISPGWYETQMCTFQPKELNTDSIYVSYNWSTGSTTEGTTISSSVTDTLTLTVEDSSGAFLTSHVICRAPHDGGNVYQVFVWDQTLCPGSVTFGIYPNGYDSIVQWSNGFYTSPTGSGCITMNYTLSPGAAWGVVYTTRTTRDGCVYVGNQFYPFMLPYVADLSEATTITESGGILTASHLYESGMYSCPDFFRWYDGTMSYVGTGKTYTPTASGTYFAEYRLCTPNSWEGWTCLPIPSFSYCNTALSLPYTLVNVPSGALEASITLSPNPATGSFRIDGAAYLKKVQILSPDARILKTYEPSEDYSLEQLSAGLYWVMLQVGDNVVTKPLMVE
jgi:hypothetical protein